MNILSKKSWKLMTMIQIFILLPSYSIAKPKYGPEGHPKAIPLWQSNDYFRNPKNPAPQFWSLISYYIPEFTGAACSVASVTMVLNAALVRIPKTSEDKVVSQPDLLEKVKTDHWKERVSSKGYEGNYGADLDLLGKLVEDSFKAYGLNQVQIKSVHVNNHSGPTRQELVKFLKIFSTSKDHFIIANFNQKSFTDDAEAGHFAPVGAYDPVKNRVLILDPDREYYEPYWVSVNDFIQGMETMDSGAKKHRGYLWISLTQ